MGLEIWPDFVWLAITSQKSSSTEHKSGNGGCARSNECFSHWLHLEDFRSRQFTPVHAIYFRCTENHWNGNAATPLDKINHSFRSNCKHVPNYTGFFDCQLKQLHEISLKWIVKLCTSTYIFVCKQLPYSGQRLFDAITQPTLTRSHKNPLISRIRWWAHQFEERGWSWWLLIAR